MKTNINSLPPIVLIACPVHENKEYAVSRWLNAAKQIDCPGKVIRLYDFSPNIDFAKRWGNALDGNLDIIHCRMMETDLMQRMMRTYEIIRRDFISGPFAKWLNIEIDVIVEPDVYRILTALGEWDWLSHGYPARDGSNLYQNGFGCSLFNKHFMNEASFYEENECEAGDGYFWSRIKHRQFKIADLYGAIRLEHIDA